MAVVIVAVVWSRPAGASTTIPGGNIINQTWTAAGSPYIVQGDVIVPPGSTLTIQPGVEVQVASTDAQASGSDPTRVEFTINGALNATGTSQAPILFHAQSGTTASIWTGIGIGAGASSANIAFATISNAGTAISNLAPGTAFGAANLTISACLTGISVQAGTPALSNLTISGVGAGVSYIARGGGTLSSSIITGATSVGVLVNGIITTSTVTVTNSTIYGGGGSGVRALSLEGGSVTLLIKNSIIAGNISGVLVDTSASGTLVVSTTYSDVGNNATNFISASPGIGTFSADPLFVNPPADLRLKAASPCVGAGDTGQDIGALGHLAPPPAVSALGRMVPLLALALVLLGLVALRSGALTPRSTTARGRRRPCVPRRPGR
ncbi:MAG TPA: hypothetical protein VKQ32_15225 [Polyangia bacterium]|nr:hypothetical protein [Polyangia bacterium]